METSLDLKMEKTLAIFNKLKTIFYRWSKKQAVGI